MDSDHRDDEPPSNPLSMPEFALLNSGVLEVPIQPKQAQQVSHSPKSKVVTFPEVPQTRFLVYRSSADEHDYMIFRYRWGRAVLTPVFLMIGIAVLTLPLSDPDNALKQWEYYALLLCAIILLCVGLFNGLVVFYFRNNPRLSLSAVRLYELCAVVGGVAMCVTAAANFDTPSACEADELSQREILSACDQIQGSALLATVVLTCLVPCRCFIAIIFGSIIPLLITFIVRLAHRSDSTAVVATKLIVSSFITGAFTVLCVQRHLVHRKRYEMERVISTDNAKMRATQQLVLETLETIFPAGLVSRLVRGLSVVSMSRGTAVGVCDIGDLSLLNRILSPSQIVALLNELTNVFDAAVERSNGEKLKTFGDRFAFTVGLIYPTSSPLEAVTAATAIGGRFLLDKTRHPLFSALATSNRAMLPLRTCIGFGPCTGGLVGVRSISYEVFSPALSEIDSILPECPVNLVVATQAAASQCSELYATAPCMTATVMAAGGVAQTTISVFKALLVRDAGPTGGTVAFNQDHESKVIEANAAELRRHAELAGAIFKWGSRLEGQVPPIDEESASIWLLKDDLLGRALEIFRTLAGSAAETTAQSEQERSAPSTVELAAVDDARSRSAEFGYGQQREATYSNQLCGANYVSEIEDLLSVMRVPGKVIPHRYENDALEQLFGEFERAVVLENMMVIVYIFGFFFVVVLIDETTSDGYTTSIPLLLVGIALCSAFASFQWLQKSVLQNSRLTHYLFMPLLAGLMALAYASFSAANSDMFAENTFYVQVLNLGLIASCSTRFSHSVFLNVANAVANSLLMKNSQSLTPLMFFLMIVSSLTGMFTPLEVERGLRGDFELALLGSALRREVREELVVASVILHHTLPQFVAHQVLRHSQTITNLFLALPNVCVLAIRVDGFSRAACDGMLQSSSGVRTISLVDEFVCSVEECISNAVAHSIGIEAAVSKSGNSIDSKRLANETAEENDGRADVLVKVSALGDKIIVFGPLLEKSGDRQLRTAARAMLHAMEHIHALILGKYPTCVATSMATLDSGMVVVVGRSRCTPNIMGVAARKADLLLRAAPDGYIGIARSFAKGISALQLSLPLPQCRCTISESESWRVRGVGAAEVHRMISNAR